MEKNKNVPAIRFKGFTEEWEERKLGEIGLIITGSTPPTNDKSNYNGNYLFVSPADIQDYRYIEKTLTTLSQKGFNICRTLNIGAILFVCIGSTIGKIAQLKTIGSTNQQINAIVPNEFFYDDFVYALMLNKSKYIKGLAATQAVPIINKTNFSNVVNFVSHDLNEQKKIGNFFQNIDKLIEARQNKLDKLKTMKKACLEKMFPKKGATVPEIRFKGFSDEWKEKELGEIGNSFTGLSGKTKEDFGHGDAEFITYMNVFTNPITKRSGTEIIAIDKTQNEVQHGDIFFTTSSETPEEVGMSSVWLYEDRSVYLNSFCFGYRLNMTSDPYYLAYLLRSPSIRSKIIFLAQGISRYNISKTKVMDINIQFPHVTEQTQIGTFFKKVDDLIAKNEQQIAKLKNIKKACLEKMFVNTNQSQ